MEFDLTGLTVAQIIIVAAVLAVVDTGYAVLMALVQRRFSLAVVAEFLTTHVLQRVFPIYALLAISATLNEPASSVIMALALGGLTAYLLETIGSISGTLRKA